MTGWHFWIGTGDLATWRPGNSGSNLAPSGGQRHLVANTRVYKEKFHFMFDQLTKSYQATRLALEQPPIMGLKYIDL